MPSFSLAYTCEASAQVDKEAIERLAYAEDEVSRSLISGTTH